MLRKYAWAPRNQAAIVSLPFSRGKRTSVLAAIDVTGFFTWDHTDGTFTRSVFHSVFQNSILPYLNPWPLPRSIVVLDNAKIHMYAELQDMVHSVGALLFFLPPYSPDLNPIEVAFSLLKRWIQKHANMAFKENPIAVLQVAMRMCTKSDCAGEDIYSHCGYKVNQLSINELSS